MSEARAGGGAWWAYCTNTKVIYVSQSGLTFPAGGKKKSIYDGRNRSEKYICSGPATEIGWVWRSKILRQKKPNRGGPPNYKSRSDQGVLTVTSPLMSGP